MAGAEGDSAALAGNGAGSPVGSADVPRRHRARARRQGPPRHPHAASRRAGAARRAISCSPPIPRAACSCTRAPRGSRCRRGSCRCRRSTPRSAACSACWWGTPTTWRSTRAGRILVPPELRRYANLDKRVVLVGQGRKFELWDEQQWQVETAQAIAFPADGLPPELVRLLALDDAMAPTFPSCSKKPWRRWRSSPPASTSTRRSAAAVMRARSSTRLGADGPPRRRRSRSRRRSPPRTRSQRAIRGSLFAARGSPNSPTSSPHLPSRRSTEPSSISESPRRRSTTPRAASLIASTVRST